MNGLKTPFLFFVLLGLLIFIIPAASADEYLNFNFFVKDGVNYTPIEDAEISVLVGDWDTFAANTNVNGETRWGFWTDYSLSSPLKFTISKEGYSDWDTTVSPSPLSPKNIDMNIRLCPKTQSGIFSGMYTPWGTCSGNLAENAIPIALIILTALLVVLVYIYLRKRKAAQKNSDLSEKIAVLGQNARRLAYYNSQVWTIITQAKNEYESGDYDNARRTLITAEQILDDLTNKEENIAQWRSKGYDTVRLEQLKSENTTTFNLAFQEFEQQLKCQEKLAELKDTGQHLLAETGEYGQIPDNLRSDVESKLLAGEISAIEDSISKLEQFRSTTKPILEIVLDTITFTANVWVLVRVSLKNTGSAHATDALLSFSEEFQTKGIKPVSIQAGATTQIEFTLMPKNAGKVLLEANLTFKDLYGREYRKTQEFWLDVVDSTGKYPASNQSATREIAQRFAPAAPESQQQSAGESLEPHTHHEVFISYSSKDKLVADAICNRLESHNIRCWIAPRDAVPGLHYQGSIIDAIDASSIMVLVFSLHSNKSRHVLTELNEAMSNNTIIIPFRIDDVLPSQDMKYVIASSHWLDAITPPIEKHIDELIKTVSLLRKKRE